MKKGAMKKGFLFLSRIGLILGLFSFCTMAMAGGIEMPPSFNGVSLLGGAQAIALRPIHLSNQQGGLVAIAAGFPSGSNYALSENTNWNVAARFGIEFGEAVFSPNFYLGANFNYMTGASYNTNTIAFTSNPNTTGLEYNTSLRTELTVNYVTDLLLKIGYIWRNSVLFFFAAGGSGANVTFVNHSLVNPAIQANYKWDPGYTGAVGIEWHIARKLLLGIDYMYSRYNTMFAPSQLSGTPAANNTTGWITSSFQTQRVGLYFKYMLNL